MSESTKKPEQAEENTTPETAPAEDTKKAEKKASKSSKKDRIAELEKELEKAQQSLKESADNFLRLAAEYDNFRKRSLREKDDIKIRSKTDVVEKLLPVIDNFERAAMNAEADADSYRKGVEQIYRQFGDILNLVGRPSAIDAVANVLGNAQQKLQQVQMLPVFIGIGLGVLLGSIPVFVPGFPAALKLGLAGGPLIMALILGRIGSIGKLYWFMPPSANLALRELGIVLFLSVVGLKSGGDFIHTLVDGEGLSWIGYGALITAVPLITVGILARMLAKMNYLTMCGMLAGSMTDPPALAFANNLHPTSGAAALSYATVYPLVMFLRIITPQLLAVLFWSIG